MTLAYASGSLSAGTFSACRSADGSCSARCSESNERAAEHQRPDRVGQRPRAVDVDRVDLGDEQDVPRLDLARLHPLDLDDVDTRTATRPDPR